MSAATDLLPATERLSPALFGGRRSWRRPGARRGHQDLPERTTGGGVAGVSFAVRSGELLAIVGPSGSGKSTLLHLMGTLDRPSTGTVRITGLDVAQMSDRELSALRATRIGFVFQQFFLAEQQSALRQPPDNVADGLLYAGVGLSERREQAADALRRVGLALAAMPAPPSSRAVSVNGWPSPGRWWVAPSCWPTSPPATSIKPPANRS